VSKFQELHGKFRPQPPAGPLLLKRPAIHHYIYSAFRAVNVFHITFPPTTTTKMRSPIFLFLMSLLFAVSVSAQFQFFDQMFGGQPHHQQHQPQNVRSDSAWYQEQYNHGQSFFCDFNKTCWR
jgi:hypothetical protein